MNNTLEKKYGMHLGNNNEMEFTTNKPIVSVVSEQTYFSCRVKYSEYDFNSELKNKGIFHLPFHLIGGADKTVFVHVSGKNLEKRQSRITQLTHVIQYPVFISVPKM